MDKRDGVNRTERGWRCGESHPRVRLTDAVVTEIRDLHELVEHGQLRYRAIIEVFAKRKPPIPLTYHVVRELCLYKRRCRVSAQPEN